MFAPDLVELREWARELFLEHGISFPEKGVAFYMHQGYVLGFFMLGNGEDPSVYQYEEGASTPVKRWNSFSEFFEQTVKEHSL